MLFGCTAAYYTSELRPRTSSPGLVATALAYPPLIVSVSVQFKTPAATNVNHVSSDVEMFPTCSKRMRSHWVFLHTFKMQISTRALKYLMRGFGFPRESAHGATCMYARARTCTCMAYVPVCVDMCTRMWSGVHINLHLLELLHDKY